MAPLKTVPSSFDKETFDAFISAEEEFSGVSREEWRAAGRATSQWPEKENYDWWLHNGPVQVANWRRFITGGQWQVAFLPEDEPAIEIHLRVTIGQVPFEGYVDRVLEHIPTGSLAVVDLKSGRSDPMSSEQLGVYHVALDRMYGGDFTPAHGAYFMTRKGTMTAPLDLRKYADGRLDYDYRAVWTAMQGGLFVPKVGPLCGSCGVRDYCRAVDGPKADEYLPYEKETA